MIFYITVANGCATLQIDVPEAIDTTPFDFPLYKSTFMRFTYAYFNPPSTPSEPWYNCGVLNYKLLDADTLAPIDENVFWLDLSSS